MQGAGVSWADLPGAGEFRPVRTARVGPVVPARFGPSRGAGFGPGRTRFVSPGRSPGYRPRAAPAPCLGVTRRENPTGWPERFSFWTGQMWGKPRKCWARRTPARPAGWETCDTADLEICATGGRLPALVAQASKPAVSPTSKSAGVRRLGGARIKSPPRRELRWKSVLRQHACATSKRELLGCPSPPEGPCASLEVRGRRKSRAGSGSG